MAQHFSDFSGKDGNPTEAERRLIEATDCGKPADCSNIADPTQRIVSATLIRKLATNTFYYSGRAGRTLAPDGIRLIGAVIPNCLWLANCHIPAQLIFHSCILEAGVNMPGSVVEGHCFFNSCTISGSLILNAARICGQFAANDTRIVNSNAYAVLGQSVTATDWFMNNSAIVGEFAIHNANISGQISTNGTTFSNPTGIAVRADNVCADGWFMNNAQIAGSFLINSARISGQFSARNAKFENINGIAINAQCVKFGHFFLDGTAVAGEMSISSAEISGQFSAISTRFINPEGTALDGFQARVAGGFFLRGIGTEMKGELHLPRCQIGTVLDLTNLTITAGADRAISLEAAEIEGPIFTAGANFFGCFDAREAHFKHSVKLRDASFSAASAIKACDTVSTSSGGTATRTASEAQNSLRHFALAMREAHFDGRLIMPASCPKGIVDLSRARCDTLEDLATGWAPPLLAGRSSCDDRICVTEAGERIDIQHIVLDGFECIHFEHPDGTDSPYGDNVGKARIKWLASQPVGDLKNHFNPQPWRMTAAVLRAMGYEEPADQVSIERRTRQRLSDGAPRSRMLSEFLLHHLGDYGYNPFKTVRWSAAIIVVFWLIFAVGEWICADGNCRPVPCPAVACAARPTFLETRHGDVEANVAYPAFQPLLYSFDLFVPILDFNSESFWRADTEAKIPVDKPYIKLGHGPAFVAQSIPVGWTLHILAILERIVGAFMVALAIFGFTGIVKREER